LINRENRHKKKKEMVSNQAEVPRSSQLRRTILFQKAL